MMPARAMTGPRRPTGAGRARAGVSPRAQAGFTLIELILVLGLLLVVAGISFPSLKNFFRHRTLDSEARRLLSLTRYGQARAASEGLPMVLWIDPQEGTYGLQVETGYVDRDPKAVEYTLDEGLSIDVSAPPAPPPTSTGLASSSTTPRQRAQIQNASLPAIRINAEGYLGDTSPETVILRQEGKDDDARTLWITQTGNRLNYEISAQPPASFGLPRR